MTLIKSISGIRGTIGGQPGDNLTPIDMVKFTAAFVKFVQHHKGVKRPRIVVGRDARLSGFLVNQVVCGTLQAMGADVLDIGLSTTPTTEIAVTGLKADAGIILTASHNPAQWNALKLLNEKGEFISAAEGAWLLDVAAKDDFDFVPIEEIGSYQQVDGWMDKHVEMVCQLPLVNKEVIAKANFKVAVDAVNGGDCESQLQGGRGCGQLDGRHRHPQDAACPRRERGARTQLRAYGQVRPYA